MSLGKDIIVFSAFRWDQPMAGASIAMVKELSKSHRVYFVDRPFSIKDLFEGHLNFTIKRKIKTILLRRKPFMKVETGFSNFVVATPGLTIPINFLPKGVFYNVLNLYNNRVVKACMARMVKEFEIKEFVYINLFNPIILPNLTLKSAKNLLTIYAVLHDINLSPYMQRHGVKAQEKALKKADLVLVNSKNQWQKIKSKVKHIYYFPNGVEYPVWESIRLMDGAPPYDLYNIGSTKVIMFCGFLSAIRVDYNLLRLVCENYPNYLVVLVGAYEEEDLINNKLEEIPNLIILGNRRYEAMPSYIKCAKVCIIPYLCNELNKSVYPLKLNEYLAMGKPVVSTLFSEDLEAFADHVYLSSSYEDFLSNIELAFQEDNAQRIEKRITLAEKNNWSYRVNLLNQLISQFIPNER